MNKKDSRSFLEQIKNTRLRIVEKERFLELLRSQAERVTTNIKLVQVSGGEANGRENILVKIIDTCHELEREREELINRQLAVMAIVKTIEPPYSTLLYLRYFDGFDWPKIAETLDYSEGHVFKIHRAALTLLQAQL